MRILHISDLHLTGQFKSFEDVWSGPSPHLAQGSFDFVVVSGDLSQRAASAEYSNLKAFLERSILPLLIERRHDRVILVPGNHDVDWSEDIGEWLPLGQRLESDSTFVQHLRQALLEPEKAEHRTAPSKYGHLDVLRIIPERYPQRFRNVQSFLDDFYKDVPRSNHFHSFALTDGDDAKHWSAHVFPESGIAFYGFNSCHKNDRYWTGAMISARAVEQARDHAEAHARDYIRIAVWHHGLDSGRGRPDRLSAQDLGLLYNAGFRIGFHGHTHRAAYETFESLFGNRFCVVSTGSLGAGSEERPDAVGNQFSIAHVHPGHVDVELFTRDGTSTTYERRRERRRFVLTEPGAPRLDQLSHATSHRRTWTVGPDGFATVEIELRDVTLHGDLTLALVEPPFCNVLPDEYAQASTGPIHVERKDLADARIRFFVSAGHEEKLPSLRWSYRISNCLALHKMDLEARGDFPSTSAQWLSPGFDGRPHTVRFPCDEMILALHLPEGVRPKGGRHEARALRRVEKQGQERWELESTESRRLRVTDDGQRMELTVSSPLVGYRYLLAYEPAQDGPRYSREHVNLLQWMLEQCRDRPPDPGTLSTELTKALGEDLKRVLGSSLDPEFTWIGCLWDPERYRLKTAFGRFPNRSWSVRFPWGSGVAGHALRVREVCTWSKEDRSHRSLLYQPNPKTSPEGDHTWIVCIPLLCSLNGPAVGVISFAGNHQGGMATEQLREYAVHLSRQGDDSGAHELRDNLFSAIHSTFWQFLRSWPELTPQRRRLVEQICKDLGLPDVSQRA